MTTQFHTEEQATGFMVFVDNLLIERDAAHAEVAELRNALGAAHIERDAWARIATGRADEIVDLHTVIADLRQQLGIRP